MVRTDSTLALIVGLIATAGWAGAETLTAGELALTVDDAARVTGLSIAGMQVTGEAAQCPLAELADVTRGPEFVAGTAAGGSLREGLTARFEGLQASATIRAEPVGEALRFTCDLAGQADLPARGVLLRLNLPVDALGWRWHDDMQTWREIGRGEVYENVTPLREWPDLPEWTEKPSLRMGAANRNFCTVLTGPVGLCLAVPLDRPCIFRTAWDPEPRHLQLVYDLALSPDTREPNRWSFVFDLYPVDPQWGFRDALARYYALHREVFEVHVPEPGQWMAFSPLSQIDNVNEFRFGLQEGAREVAYDDKIGVLDTIYLTHAGQFADVPDYDSETDPVPPHETLVQVMTERFRQSTGDAQMYPAVGLHDAEGKLDIRVTRVYGDIIAQFNLDPELPYGAWTLERATQLTQSELERSGGRLDGFYYDGLTSGLNYRPDHFRYSEAPPLWDPVNNKPVLNNFFDSCAFAKAAAEMLRPRGQITMMNGAFGASFYVAPWLDIFGSEVGLRISRANMNYARTITWHKPMLTLLKGNYELGYDYDDIELFMKRALAYGIFPGFFDWSPSGLGPGSRYWDHPEYYERDRDLHRKYVPLVQTLARAGWEPVTCARSSNERVFVERFGPGEDGVAWLTLLNEDAQPHPTTLTIDAAALGIEAEAVRCLDVLSGRAIELRRRGATLEAELDVAADGVMMLQLATPAQAARWRLAQARETVELGITMREVDADKPPVAFAWHPEGDGYSREAYEGGTALVLDGNNRGMQACWQWAMLFQSEAAPVTIRVRAAAEGVEGEGNLRLLARHAWVSPGFSHYTSDYFDFPKGTWDWREFEFPIAVEQPLRAIYLRPEMDAGLSGRLKIASISIDDGSPAQYVENPDFSRWYEPVPPAMRDRLAAGSRQLLSALEAAQAAVAGDLTGAATRQALLEVGSLTTRLREWIVAEGAENGCRRALRDIETVEAHLAPALLASLGLEAPTLQAPSLVAAGDEVPVRFRVGETGGLPVRTSVSVEGPAQMRPTPEGGMLSVPADAEAGTLLKLAGVAMVGPEDRAAPIRVTRTIQVVDPLTVELTSEGTDPGTGAFRVAVSVRNNRAQAAEVRVALDAPPGWRAPGPQTLRLDPGAQERASVLIAPEEGAEAGSVEIAATATSGPASARVTGTMLYIPAEANLLRNPGFEEGMTGWSGSGSFEIDTQVAHGGAASVRLRNASDAEEAQVSQTVTLDQEEPVPILVRAASRAEGVSGYRGTEYSLYVDIYYTDGTPLYGRIVEFEPGTHEWQIAEQIIEPEKPIRNVNVYLLLRRRAGTAWFDDVAVMEDPRRQGNIAREASVEVDSAYSGYDAEPINDGVVHPPADAHWTDEAWASAETATDHWVELRFDQPRTIDRAVVYWSQDAGVPRSSAEVSLQVGVDEGWRTLATVRPEPLSAATAIRLDQPATGTRFRILQPAGRGPRDRPNLMWVREVELFAGE
ncbi:MAG: discoidin domain-containing protein [Armatimonadota bacterium]